MSRRIILSGIQASGVPHIGNYVGALRNWILLQYAENIGLEESAIDQGDLFYMIADLHALTVNHDPKMLNENIKLTAASFLACGLEPERCTIFQQSTVKQHAELCWYLTCNTPMGWLKRMTQFKDKGENQESVGAGLFTYPALMAADILLYRATDVPVGNDQRQHLEFAGDLARKMNSRFGKNLFAIPNAVVSPQLRESRIMSLRDGNKKMSKSDPSPMSRILLTDSKDEISKKIRKSQTDSLGPLTENCKRSDRPAVFNLLSLYAVFSGINFTDAYREMIGQDAVYLKNRLTDVLVDEIVPIGDDIRKIVDDEIYLNQVLKDGTEKAQERAEQTVQSCKEAMGLIIQ